MKKTLTVLMMTLLVAMLIVSCSNEPKTVTINITYDLSGGALADGVTNPVTATTGETVTPTGPTRNTDTQTVSNYSIDDYLNCDSASVTSTYTFKGWKVEGAADSTASKTYTAGTKDVKLVAVWDKTSTAANCSGIKLKDTVNSNTTITLGSYNNSDITWKVLYVDATNKKALLFATNNVTSMKQRKSDDLADPYSWTNSPIYDWFNNTGNDGFLSQCKLDNVSMKDNGSVGKVFLLAKSDLNSYLPNNSDRALGSEWWLRSNDGSQLGNCNYVTATGDIGTDKSGVLSCGVRPAFWISL